MDVPLSAVYGISVCFGPILRGGIRSAICPAGPSVRDERSSVMWTKMVGNLDIFGWWSQPRGEPFRFMIQ